MTILLVLLFLCVVLPIGYIGEMKKKRTVDQVRTPDMFIHENGLMPTMADGGQKKPT